MNLPWKKSDPLPDEVRYPVSEVIPPEDMDDEQRIFSREVAGLEAKFALEMRDRLITEMGTSARWLQASLLVVNGGAAAALLGSDVLASATKAEAGAAFVVGLTLALLNGFVGIIINSDGPKRFYEFAGYWTAVGVTLQRSEEAERDWQRYGERVRRRSRLGYVIGFTSVAAFLTGCAVVARDLFT